MSIGVRRLHKGVVARSLQGIDTLCSMLMPQRVCWYSGGTRIYSSAWGVVAYPAVAR
ncbi:hypothetical protein LCGC14_3058520, partial [marine sediment metagenome]